MDWSRMLSVKQNFPQVWQIKKGQYIHTWKTTNSTIFQLFLFFPDKELSNDIKICICINSVCVGSELEVCRLDNWLLLIKFKLWFEEKGSVGDQVIFRTKEWLLHTLWCAQNMLIILSCFKAWQVMEKEPSWICTTSQLTAFKCYVGLVPVSTIRKWKNKQAQRKPGKTGVRRAEPFRQSLCECQLN